MKFDYAKLTLTFVFCVYFVRCLFSPHNYLFIYLVDFVFHEAGHIVFSFMGKFIMDLGGTLMQLLLPISAFLYFLKARQFHSASLILFWIGENWINISVYARDARSRALPLHGGDAVTHDWSEILYTLNLLPYDHAIGNLFYAFGALSMAAGLVLGIYFARRDFSENAATL